MLHTHTRRLDYHPHVHVVIPGGGIHKARKEWRKLKGDYLFNGRALAKVFRGECLAFQYRDSQTNTVQTRTLRGETFIYVLLQHVLPKGFRRARDYGFLQSNAKQVKGGIALVI